VGQLLGDHPAQGDPEHVELVVAEGVQQLFDGPGDAADPSGPAVGAGLAAHRGTQPDPADLNEPDPGLVR
jgi:hypothetical protein